MQRGGWNKRGGGIFWKKLVYKCNKRGVEGGNVRGGWNFFFFSKSISVTPRLLER